MNFFFIDNSGTKNSSIKSSILMLFTLVTGWIPPASSDEVTIAVATNFYPVLEKLKTVFEEPGKDSLLISSGSTGHLYAQIKNGAPYDVFLAADTKRPLLLEEEGLGVAGTRFTYAAGKLVLTGSSVHGVIDGVDVIRKGDFLSLAIANPDLAPYGLAAQQALVRLGLWDQVRDKIVLGENIGQAYSLVHTGNADLGFVSLAQVIINNKTAIWNVPETYHDPIIQQAILLSRAVNNPAAHHFLEFLKSNTATEIISSSGYAVE